MNVSGFFLILFCLFCFFVFVFLLVGNGWFRVKVGIIQGSILHIHNLLKGEAGRFMGVWVLLDRIGSRHDGLNLEKGWLQVD